MVGGSPPKTQNRSPSRELFRGAARQRQGRHYSRVSSLAPTIRMASVATGISRFSDTLGATAHRLRCPSTSQTVFVRGYECLPHKQTAANPPAPDRAVPQPSRRPKNLPARRRKRASTSRQRPRQTMTRKIIPTGVAANALCSRTWQKSAINARPQKPLPTSSVKSSDTAVNLAAGGAALTYSYR